jgi:hypothetical protein
MAAVGGDFIEITYNHPTLGSGTFFPKAAEDSTLDLGGIRGEDDANMVDGGGNNIKQLTRNRWRFEGTISNDMNIREDAEVITALAGSPVDAEWTFSHINGTVYIGTGSPVGDVQPSGQSATLEIIISGGGVMKKI